MDPHTSPRLAASPPTLPPVPAVEKDLILSLFSSSKPSVRSRNLDSLASSASSNSNSVPTLELLRVFLAFTIDPYPYVRRSALQGLVTLIRAYFDESHRCYRRAVELLMDADEVVRSAAVRVVSEYAQMLADSDHGENQEGIDEAFVRLCSMARDMSMEVRLEAFHALGKIRLASEDVLLQTISKKVLGTKHERKILSQCTGKEFVSLVSSAAGAFIHGLEDEFHEVRRAACNSLGMLAIFSTRFADESLNLLMDMLNDDTMVVRSQTLETMFYMASYDHLKVQEPHTHMFLGCLADSAISIRCATRRLLRVIKLVNLEMFSCSIKALLSNLETYPEDEVEICSIIFYIGRNHEKFAASFVKEFAQEIVPFSEGELGLDRPSVTALLLLSLSAQISYEQLTSCVPTKAFSYALALLGKMSCSIREVVYQNPLPNNWVDNGPIYTPIKEYQQKVTFQKDSAISSVRLLLIAVADTWHLIKSRCIDEALKILRCCKKELAMITVPCYESLDVLAFATKYIKVVKLLTRVWEYVEPRLQVTGIGVLDLLLERLDINLLGLRYGFHGLSHEEEFHVLELMVLSFILRLSMVGACCDSTLKRLHSTISRLEFLCTERSMELSRFVKELKKSLADMGNNKLAYPFSLSKFIELFSFEQIVFRGSCRVMKAELNVPGNDSENALPFISGLPVGIKFNITLYNILNKDRLWLQMVVGEFIQYVFLDLDQFEGSGEVNKCTIDLPFYGTPKTSSFSLLTRIGIECPFEDDVYPSKGRGGPKCKLIFLCNEKEVYLINMERKQLMANLEHFVG